MLSKWAQWHLTSGSALGAEVPFEISKNSVLTNRFFSWNHLVVKRFCNRNSACFVFAIFNIQNILHKKNGKILGDLRNKFLIELSEWFFDTVTSLLICMSMSFFCQIISLTSLYFWEKNNIKILPKWKFEKSFKMIIECVRMEKTKLVKLCHEGKKSRALNNFQRIKRSLSSIFNGKNNHFSCFFNFKKQPPPFKGTIIQFLKDHISTKLKKKSLPAPHLTGKKQS